MAKTVIDVSYAQPSVDWERAKYDIDGAILRCGYGSDILSQDDKQWARNIVEVERLGIPYGVYLYSYADNDAEIQSEINHCLRLIKGHNPVLGVFLDLEENSKGGIAPRAAKEWCRQINAAGYKAGIYCGAYYYKQFMRGVYEAVTALWWIAGYGTNSGIPERHYTPDPGFKYDAWQYTSKKIINGINGGVDCSEWYADFDAEPAKPAEQSKADTELLQLVSYAWSGNADKITKRHAEVIDLLVHIVKSSTKTLTDEVIADKYSKDPLRASALGPRRDEVQKEVNKRYK